MVERLLCVLRSGDFFFSFFGGWLDMVYKVVIQATKRKEIVQPQLPATTQAEVKELHLGYGVFRDWDLMLAHVNN